MSFFFPCYLFPRQFFFSLLRTNALYLHDDLSYEEERAVHTKKSGRDILTPINRIPIIIYMVSKQVCQSTKGDKLKSKSFQRPIWMELLAWGQNVLTLLSVSNKR